MTARDSFRAPSARARARCRRAFAVQLLLAGGVLSSAQAQPPAPSESAVLFTGRDLALFAGATLGAGALTKLDVRIAHMLYDSLYQVRHPGVTLAAHRASKVTETLLMITGGMVWGVARLNHDDGTADVALHATEAVASTAMVIQVVRGALGRARPYVIDELGEKRNSDPYEVQFLHGFTSYNYRSFPSMHATASFATASALASEMRRRNTPHRGVITSALYLGAAMPSLARLYLDEHWASDIAMGIFLGVFAGQKVVNYSHDHPDNYVDRRFLKPSVRATFTHSARGLSFAITPF